MMGMCHAYVHVGLRDDDSNSDASSSSFHYNLSYSDGTDTIIVASDDADSMAATTQIWGDNGDDDVANIGDLHDTFESMESDDAAIEA